MWRAIPRLFHLLLLFSVTPYAAVKASHVDSQAVLDQISEKEMFSVIHSALLKSQTASCWYTAVENLLCTDQPEDSTSHADVVPPGCARLGFDVHSKNQTINEDINSLRQKVALAFTNCQLQEDGLRTYESIESLVAAQNVKLHDGTAKEEHTGEYFKMRATLLTSEAKMAYGVYTQYRLHLLSLCRHLEKQSADFATHKAMHDLQHVTVESSRLLGDAIAGIGAIEEIQKSILEKSGEIQENIAQTEENENRRRNRLQQGLDSLLMSVDRVGKDHIASAAVQNDQASQLMRALAGIFETTRGLVDVVEMISQNAQYIVNATNTSATIVSGIQRGQERALQHAVANLGTSRAITDQQRTLIDSFDSLQTLTNNLIQTHAVIGERTTETVAKIAELDNKFVESFHAENRLLRDLHSVVESARDQTEAHTKTIVSNQHHLQKWMGAMQRIQEGMSGKLLQFDAMRFYAISFLFVQFVTAIEHFRGGRFLCHMTLVIGWFSEGYFVEAPGTRRMMQVVESTGAPLMETYRMYRLVLSIICSTLLYFSARLYRSPDQQIRQALKEEMKFLFIREGSMAGRVLRRSVSLARAASLPVGCRLWYENWNIRPKIGHTLCSMLERLVRLFVSCVHLYFQQDKKSSVAASCGDSHRVCQRSISVFDSTAGNSWREDTPEPYLPGDPSQYRIVCSLSPGNTHRDASPCASCQSAPREESCRSFSKALQSTHGAAERADDPLDGVHDWVSAV
ncbi:tRNA modification GTPase [Perkinsela sp. CCAP 1560/4]|nr:tRNA modification GTPase [Perkinsela sp. CCAP 1560/4]KNH06727.1 tRNA modification GTPase [Perkinsela sp. CCAP 1560/4]|eukprot:KNH06530.1 tRNA modification GTPase [Perkinsela sp. CCAP 1560/4]